MTLLTLRPSPFTLPRVELTSRGLSDLYLLTNGGFHPLRGFLGHDDARSVVERLELADGTLWPIPILLQVDPANAELLHPGTLAALWHGGRAVGTIRIEECFPVPLTSWARAIFKTDDRAHPGVDAFFSAVETAVAGPVHWRSTD